MTIIVKGNTDEFDLAVCAFDPHMPGKVDEIKLLKEWRTGQFKIDRSNRTRHDARLRLEVGDGFNVLFVIPKGVVSKAAYTYQILSKP
jgi:hypothetical protein